MDGKNKPSPHSPPSVDETPKTSPIWIPFWMNLWNVNELSLAEEYPELGGLIGWIGNLPPIHNICGWSSQSQPHLDEPLTPQIWTFIAGGITRIGWTNWMDWRPSPQFSPFVDETPKKHSKLDFILDEPSKPQIQTFIGRGVSRIGQTNWMEWSPYPSNSLHLWMKLPKLA